MLAVDPEMLTVYERCRKRRKIILYLVAQGLVPSPANMLTLRTKGASMQSNEDVKNLLRGLIQSEFSEQDYELYIAYEELILNSMQAGKDPGREFIRENSQSPGHSFGPAEVAEGLKYIAVAWSFFKTLKEAYEYYRAKFPGEPKSVLEFKQRLKAELINSGQSEQEAIRLVNTYGEKFFNTLSTAQAKS